MLRHVGVLAFALVTMVVARPQLDRSGNEIENHAPMPYNFEYKVEDQPTDTYFGQNEVGTETGRVDGSYFVWLPDGRLMTVTYYVDGESGFVPQIKFEDAANPFAGRR